jgi:hypothetical protein
MKPRYITLITQRADPEDHPRGHLRWMELDENGLKLGFSSGSVVLRGANLDLLMRDLLTADVEVIQARPERPAEPGSWEVHSIGAPVGNEKTKGTTKSPGTLPEKP